MAPALLVYDTDVLRSRAVPAAESLRAIIAASPSFIELIDGKTGADALTHTSAGMVSDTWAGGEATRDDLDALLCHAYVLSHPEAPSRSYQSDAIGACPRSEHTLMVRLRRQIREADIGANGGEIEPVFNYLWDRCEMLRYEIVLGATETGGAASDLRDCELSAYGLGTRDREASQGPHFWAEFSCGFGIPEEG